MQNLSRRRFIHLAIGAGSALGAGAVGCRLIGDGNPTSASAAPPITSLQEYTQSSRALGADVSITALHADRATAQAGVEAAFAELELVESLMSIYRPQSQLSRLNRDGALKNPHPYFVDVLRLAQSVSQRSQGAFDVTVQPLWALFREAQTRGELPDDAKIAAARQNVDWRRLVVDDDRLSLSPKGMAITLNGIAQGYAADRAMAALRTHGIAHALVNAGELGALGGKGRDKPWSVGIQHPRREDAYVALADLDGRCLATSGDYSTTFGDGYLHHHLFDPRTGRSSNLLASATVAANTAAEADALSTAVFVLGLENGLKLVRATPGADALLVDKEGRLFITAGFPQQA